MTRSTSTLLFEIALAVVFAGIAGLAAYVASQRLPARFVATAQFEMADDPLLTGDRPAGPYRLAPRRTDVLRDALVALGVRDPEPGQVAALRARVAPEFRTDAEGGGTLRIEVSGEERETVRRHVEALADAVASWDVSSTRARVRSAADDLDVRIDRLDDRIRARQVLGVGVPSNEAEPLLHQRHEATAERERAAELLASGAPVRSLEARAVTVERTGPRPLRNGVVVASLAAVLSVLLGVRVPVLAPLRGAGTRAGAESSKASFLASFPRAEAGDDGPLRSAAARLRSAVLGRTIGASTRVVVFTSATERSGTTTIACHLAEDFARQGWRVLLVDGDLRVPDVARRYALADRSDGVGAVATTLAWLQDPRGRHRVASVVLDDDTTVDVVPQFRATRAAPGTGEALFEGFGRAVERWSKYEVVIVDTAAVTAVEDTRLLARHATGVVLVVRSGAPDERLLATARRRVRDAGTSLVGMVENDVPPERKVAAAVSPPPGSDAYPRVVRGGDTGDGRV